MASEEKTPGEHSNRTQIPRGKSRRYAVSTGEIQKNVDTALDGRDTRKDDSPFPEVARERLAWDQAPSSGPRTFSAAALVALQSLAAFLRGSQ